MAALPVAAFKRVTVIINGVTKNVIIPVSSHASQQDLKDCTVDDECVIVNVESSRCVPHSQYLDVEPVEISPCENEPVCSTINRNVTFEKNVPCCGISDPVQTSVTNMHPVVAHLQSNRPTGIVNPMSFSSSDSANKTQSCTARTETEQPDPTAIFADITGGFAVDNVELDLQSAYSQADPVVIAPASDFGVSSPRTMTKEEAIAAGWYNDEDAKEQVPSSNATTAIHPTKTSVLSGTTHFLLEHVTENNFVSSAEYVSLETSSGYSADLAVGADNHLEIVPTMFGAEEMPCCAISEDPEIKVSMAVDGRPHRVAKLEKPTFDCADDEDNYYRLMSEEDEPLTAVLESMDQDNAIHVAKVKPQFKKSAEHPLKRGRGRPSKRLPSSGHDATKKTNRLLSKSAKSLSAKPVIKIDMAYDGRARLSANLQQPTLNCDEEVDPLTAIMEGIDNDDGVCMALSKTRQQYKKLTGNTAALKRSRGRPRKKLSHSGYDAMKKTSRILSEKAQFLRAKLVDKTATKTGTSSTLKLPSSTYGPTTKVNMAKRTGGRPLTAVERYRLKDCGVWLQKLGLSTATINVRAVWRYMCCRYLKPHASVSCSLCHSIELKVAREFHAGVKHCTRAAKVQREFSLDPNLLPEYAATASNESKKYLLVRTKTGTFFVPVDDAVGCIISEQEVAKMMSSQLKSSGEYSVNSFLAARSHLR